MIPSDPPRTFCAGRGRIIAAMHAANCVLLALVILARALVPVGFMPERDARTGEIVIAMCSGKTEHETTTIHLPGPSPRKDSERKDCPFAVTTALPAYQLQAAAAPALVQFPLSYSPTLTAPPIASLRRPNAPPTGPPAFA